MTTRVAMYTAHTITVSGIAIPEYTHMCNPLQNDYRGRTTSLSSPYAEAVGRDPGFPRGYVPGPLHGYISVPGPGTGTIIVATCDRRGRI